MALAYEMSMLVRELAAEGIRRDHPDWTEKEVSRRTVEAGIFSGSAAAWAAMSIAEVLERITAALEAQQIENSWRAWHDLRRYHDLFDPLRLGP